MMFGYFYLDSTLLILIPGIVLALWAQTRVRGVFNEYSGIFSNNGWTAEMMARRILDENGLHDVQVTGAAGVLSDHYDPRRQVLRLSESVHGSSSLAALGVAAHEVGHALQHRHGYAPMALRSAIVPVASIGSYLAWPLLIFGMLMANQPLILWGVCAFGFAVLFQLVTLPVELNASRRALTLLEEGGYLTQMELPGARKVLSAAALTYLAALLMGVLQLLRLLLLTGMLGGRRRR